jgi:hypothetical protein
LTPIVGKKDMELILADRNDLDIKLGGILVTVFVINRWNGINTDWTKKTVAFSVSAEGFFRNEVSREGAVTRIVIL